MPFPCRVKRSFTAWSNCAGCLTLAISYRLYMAVSVVAAPNPSIG